VRTPARLSEGDLNLPYTRDVDAARRLHENMYMLGNSCKRFGGEIMAPLDLAPFDPDVIVKYIIPVRAVRFIIAFGYAKGEALSIHMTGQASLCSAIARTVYKNEMTVDMPCMGRPRLRTGPGVRGGGGVPGDAHRGADGLPPSHRGRRLLPVQAVPPVKRHLPALHGDPGYRAGLAQGPCRKS
jgi:hypothetical protein